MEQFMKHVGKNCKGGDPEAAKSELFLFRQPLEHSRDGTAGIVTK